MSTNACNTKVSMLLSLLLANIRISSCFFFLFLVIFSNFLTISVVTEKNKIRLALAFPTGAPTILVNEIIDTSLLVALKTKNLVYVIKSGNIFNFLLHDFL